MSRLTFKGLLKKLEVPTHQGIEATALISHDVQPIEIERRSWGTMAFFSVWASFSFSMSTWQIGAAFLSLGLNYWQAILACLVGHILAMSLVLVTSFPGLDYNVSFPISTRMAWGFMGTIFVVVLRMFVSIVSAGTQAWQGGLMCYICLRTLWPSIDHIHNTIPVSTGMNLPQFIGFIGFMAIQIAMILLNPRQLQYLAYVASIAGFLVQVALVIWSTTTMGSKGFGLVLHPTDTNLSAGTTGWLFMYAVTIVVSSQMGGTMSVCDYTRYAKRPKDGIRGQLLAWVPGWLSNVLGILTVAATQNRFGAELWSVVQLLAALQDYYGTSGARAAAFFCGLSFLSGQMALNTLGNTFIGGTDLSSFFPKFVNIRRGQYITMALGVAINPWYLLASATVFLALLGSFSVLLQPFLGILAAYYFVMFRRRVNVEDLFRLKGSIYWYNHGVNWRSIVSWICGVALNFPGFVNNLNPAMTIPVGASRLYWINIWTGFFIPFFMSIGLAYLFPVAEQHSFVNSVTFDQAIEMKERYIETLQYVGQNEVLNGIRGLESSVKEGSVPETYEKQEKATRQYSVSQSLQSGDM